MALTGDILAFRDAYWSYKNDVLEPTEAEMRTLLGRWRSHEHWAKHRRGHVPGLTIPSPVQRTDFRIKRLESVEDKIRRHPATFPDGWAPASFRQMDDALGVRVVIYFLSDFSLIHDELHLLSDDLEIQSDPRPKAYLPDGLTARLNLGAVDRKDKPSGYASIHYYCRLRRSSIDIEDRPWIEVQVRTLAEDAWAEVHHLIGYKREKDTMVEVEEETRIISAQLKVIDEHFDLLRMRLGRAQETAAPPGNKDQLNAENLPVLLLEMDLMADQREIDGLLRAMASRGIQSAGELRARATPQRLALIRRQWLAETSRQAQTFDVVGVLGTITATAEDSELEQRIEEWAAVANRWRRRRDDGDLDRLIRALRYHGLAEAKTIAALASSERLAAIRTTWIEVTTHPPTTFQIVSILAVLERGGTHDEVVHRTRVIAELTLSGRPASQRS
jgi:ppGpp synthetase/RelA/SpoT-type nucleotidyltranferase